MNDVIATAYATLCTAHHDGKHLMVKAECNPLEQKWT